MPITIAENAKGFEKSKEAAKEGGKIAGNARKALEKQTGKKVVSDKNHLSLTDRNRKNISLPNNTNNKDS